MLDTPELDAAARVPMRGTIPLLQRGGETDTPIDLGRMQKGKAPDVKPVNTSRGENERSASMAETLNWMRYGAETPIQVV